MGALPASAKLLPSPASASTLPHTRPPTHCCFWPCSLQADQLRAQFERCNGHKDCLERLVFEFGGQWKKSQISKQLKAMLLARGKLTPGQVGGRAGGWVGGEARHGQGK